MKKGFQIFLSVLAAVFVAWGEQVKPFSCDTHLSAEWKKRGWSVSFPFLGIVAEVFKIPGELAPAVKITWTLEDTLDATLDCGCPGPDCCSGPEAEVLARLTLYQVIAPLSDTIRPESGSTCTSTVASAQNTRKGGTDLCGWPGAVNLSVQNYTGSVGITAGLEWLLTVSSTRVSLNASEICRCNPDPSCYAHTNPPVLHVPNQLVVPDGETWEFEVWGMDKDGDVRFVNVSEGAEVTYFKKAGNDFAARIRVPSTLESVRIQVADECGNSVAVKRPVIVVHRPKLNVCSEGWEDGKYKVQWEAFDEDLKRCAERLDFVERLRFTYNSSSGEFTGGYADWSASCSEHDTGRVPPFGCVNAYYMPTKDKKPRSVHLSIAVEDAWGLTAKWEKDLVNDPPDLDVSPANLKVKYGERVTATVTVTDWEGDQVVLEKDFGPGSFPTAKGRGRASGAYSWVTTSRQPWHLVRFFATDGYIGPEYSYAYLLIHVLQPPRAYSGHVAVARNATATASLYVEDPDTPPKNLSVEFHPPDGISVRFLGMEGPPYYDGSYYGYTVQVEVSVDRTLCPGTYPVPFTVADPDGNSSSATLHVHVVGNRPPVASPPELRGEATLVLTPTGVVRTPVVFQPIQVWDPDGDPVVIEGYGLPPTYAANLSAFLGSLVALYTPGGLTDEDLCAVAREGDIIVDEFSLILGDSCGATTEVPAFVTLKVGDEVPPKIVYPAANKTVECDGKGNLEEFQAWLENHGGAWAFDNCCDVSWSYKIDEDVGICGGARRYRVTFTATDCARNSSSPEATILAVFEGRYSVEI